jgi:hypothetical protein
MLSLAIHSAHLAGHEPDSQAFHNHVREDYLNRDKVLSLDESQIALRDLETAYERGDTSAQADAANRISKTNTALARSRAGDDVPSMEDRMRSSSGGMASALASRDRVAGDTITDRYWSGGGERPTGKVRLSPEQVEAARFSGLTLAEYAAQVIRLRQEKAEGSHGGKP